MRKRCRLKGMECNYGETLRAAAYNHFKLKLVRLPSSTFSCSSSSVCRVLQIEWVEEEEEEEKHSIRRGLLSSWECCNQSRSLLSCRTCLIQPQILSGSISLSGPGDGLNTHPPSSYLQSESWQGRPLCRQVEGTGGAFHLNPFGPPNLSNRPR